MSRARQYVAVKFATGKRTYTYHWEGRGLLHPGDRVIVETPVRGGQELAEDTVEVVEQVDEIPEFTTKPILRRA